MRAAILAALVCLGAAPVAAQQHQSVITEAMHTVGGDFQQLASWESGLTLGGAAGLALVMLPEEREEPRLTPQTDRIEDTFEAASVLGHGLTQIGGSAALFLVGHLAHQSRLDLLGLELMRAHTINSVVTQGLKFGVGRTRPDGGPRSFPSGHTSAAFATATVLEHDFGWKVGVPSYLVAGYIGASRVAGNHHYGSDVVVGAALGLASARAVTRPRPGHHNISVTPAFGRSTVGMVLTWDAGS
jgi:membrane-associated phospholipid phosphatase